MKFNFDKEYLRENFKSTVVFIGLFILLILAIKSGNSSISQQNISTVVVPGKVEQVKNPYQMAYQKCSNPQMNKEFTQKCVEWELKNNGIK